MAETPTLEDFAAHLEEPFAIDLETDFPGLEPLVLTLIKAEPIDTGQDPGERRVPFALVFRGPGEPALAQRVYALDNATMGRVDIFLVPIGRDEEGMRYEAVFN